MKMIKLTHDEAEEMGEIMHLFNDPNYAHDAIYARVEGTDAAATIDAYAQDVMDYVERCKIELIGELEGMEIKVEE